MGPLVKNGTRGRRGAVQRSSSPACTSWGGGVGGGGDGGSLGQGTGSRWVVSTKAQL